MTWLGVLFLLSVLHAGTQDQCKDPQEQQLFTECTLNKERWRVWVTQDDCTTSDPARVADCDVACQPGEYLSDMTNCKACHAGSFSSGNSLYYPVFGPSPSYPEIQASSSKIDMSYNWPCEVWRTLDNEALSPVDSCWAELSVPFTLVNPGYVEISYLLPDPRLTMQFMVKQLSGGSCTSNNIVEKDVEANNEWSSMKLNVPIVGKLLLQIKSTSFLNANKLNELPIQPARIRHVTITGVEPPTSCKPCPTGHYSNDNSSVCTQCQEGSYAPTQGSTTCNKCSGNKFSVPGLGQCLDQVRCKEEDLVPSISACVNGKSSLSYTSLIYNKCTESSVPAAASIDCLMCQPGMQYKHNECDYCPPGKHSKDGGKCQPCPANSKALRGLYYIRWTTVPRSWRSDCEKCWIPAGDSLVGRTHGSYPTTLKLGSVKYEDTSLQGDIVGIFTVTFDLRCGKDCSLMFVEENGVVKESKSVLKTYSNTINTVYLIKVRQRSDNTRYYSIRLSGEDTMVKIKSVNFTNTVDGGASYCYPCSGAGCVECQPGMIAEGNSCKECPENTFHHTVGSVLYSNYSSSCETCPVGTSSFKGGSSCYMKCSNITLNNSTYDWSGIGDVMVYDKLSSYTDKEGNTFHNRYKIRLCTGVTSPPIVQCGSVSSSDGVMTSQLCEETVVTDRMNNETIQQPTSLGDTVLSVEARADSVVLHHTATQPTSVCQTGIAASVTVLCNQHTVKDITLVTEFLCRYKFELSGPFGCPQCTASDYRAITSRCTKGVKTTTHVWAKDIKCVGGVTLPNDMEDECTMYEESVMNTVKKYKLYFGLGFAALVLLVVALCLLLWYSSTLKHQLDGYSKLGYADGTDQDNGVGRTPPPFHWEVDEEDEEDLFSNPRYKTLSPGAMLLQKLSSLKPKMRKYRNMDRMDIIDMSDNGMGDI